MIPDFKNEIWLDIKGWEGLYQISNMGRVKAMAKKWGCGHRGEQIRVMEERIRKICYAGDGYGRVMLKGNGKTEGWLLHRLVAIYFISNPEDKPEVNHKYGDKKDNRATELEWHTPEENMQHAHRIGLKQGLTGKENPSSRPVLNLQTGIYYDSAKEAFSSTNYKRYQTLVDKLSGAKFNNTSMVYV